MTTEIASGCVPFKRNKEGQLIACMILRPGGYWEFPKGKQEGDESLKETALRELKEETGMEGVLESEEPMSMEYTFSRNDEAIRKQVTYFICRVPNASVVVPQQSEVNDSVWLPLEDLPDRATYPELKAVARKVLTLLSD